MSLLIRYGWLGFTRVLSLSSSAYLTSRTPFYYLSNCTTVPDNSTRELIVAWQDSYQSTLIPHKHRIIGSTAGRKGKAVQLNCCQQSFGKGKAGIQLLSALWGLIDLWPLRQCQCMLAFTWALTFADTHRCKCWDDFVSTTGIYVSHSPPYNEHHLVSAPIYIHPMQEEHTAGLLQTDDKWKFVYTTPVLCNGCQYERIMFKLARLVHRRLGGPVPYTKWCAGLIGSGMV